MSERPEPTAPKPIAMEDREIAADDRIFSPSAARNRDPILKVLRPLLKAEMKVFEIASGTGEHAVHLVKSVPGIVWQPTDQSPEALRSIEAWRAHEKLEGLLPPLVIDARSDDWPAQDFCPVDMVVCVNMFHISPWEAGAGVIRGAGRSLRPGGHLCIYGPFSEGGVHNAPSNAKFDEQLRAADPAWGIRDIERLSTEAERNGLALDSAADMPANNRTLIFRKTG